MDIRTIFFDLGNTLVTTPRAWLPGAKSLLESLSAHAFRLGVLSNTGTLPTREAILQILPTDFSLDVFDPALVVFSSEAGIEKPSPAIFRLAVERTGGPAAHCLYCSEDIVETLVAQFVGLRAARVQPPPHSDLGVIEQRLAEFQAVVVPPG